MPRIAKAASRRRLLGDGWRFLLAGGCNTVLTLGLYQVLLFWLSEKISWTIAWLGGLLLLSLAYPKLVFRGSFFTPARVLLNILYYLLAFGASLFLLTFFTRTLQAGPRLAALLVIAVTVPVNFVFSRLIFTAPAGK
jgi:putative flippase GtrA